MKKVFTFLFVLLVVLNTQAENWNTITTCGNYYFGEGSAENEEDANRQALEELWKMIAHDKGISADFALALPSYSESREVTDENKSNLIVGRMLLSSEEGEPSIRIGRYMERSSLEKLCEKRVQKAKGFMDNADEALKRNRAGRALRDYYWAYALLCTVQHPDRVKDANGKPLKAQLEKQIGEILSDISVNFHEPVKDRSGEYMDVDFFYKSEPISGEFDFCCEDGTAIQHYTGKDGSGEIVTDKIPVADVNRLNIEYEFMQDANSDLEIKDVLSVLTPKQFAQAEKRRGTNTNNAEDSIVEEEVADNPSSVGMHLEVDKSQIVEESDLYVDRIEKVIKAIQSMRYSDVHDLFTFEGREMFEELCRYGKARIKGADLRYMKSTTGEGAIVRGLQMTFDFKKGTKRRFMEDVVFSFNGDGLIDNVAFGLGQAVENEILGKKGSKWTNEMKEQLMGFLESYKTAYCLKRLEYLKTIFSDDAVIIVGNSVKRSQSNPMNEGVATFVNAEDFEYSRQDKKTYMERLGQVFKKNEFINIQFTESDIQWVEKYPEKSMFAVDLRQEYNSTHYGDKGWLFLLVDLTNEDEPLILTRAFDQNKRYSIGDFVTE